MHYIILINRHMKYIISIDFRTMDFTSSSLETNGTYFACESNQVPGRRTPLSAVGLGGYYFPQPSSVASDENSPGPACQQFNNGSDNRLAV